MDAIEFINERQRMCAAFTGGCTGCPLDGTLCGGFNNVEAERLVGAVEEWSAAHPPKTHQSAFLEHYPNARLDSEGVICICPEAVYDDEVKALCIKSKMCHDCRHTFWLQEVKE